ncbi:hypothetical protein [Jeongeupia chitinilytica]|uniref:DUF3313 domain-containing protein n=1 Tax=Jeongeupia chitinilytica TaxID=1041641 RepID=A0ABQ3H2V9_9NEIS|nr:hypothetical protein [Jeongeupia chitinilytica]GHD64497.1 hypothetical protein GCM10007350_23790 [Jeongeupia chitinilytica]
MKHLSLLLASLVLSGCASQQPVMLANTSPAATRFTLEDRRLDVEKTNEMLSYLITSCDYGITRIGDSRTDPDKVAVLKSDLQALAGDRLEGRHLKLQSYTVHLNNAVMLKQQVGSFSGAYAGLLGSGLFMAMTEIGCSKDQVSGGWYTADEVSNAWPPVIAEATLSVDGASYRSRVVATAANNTETFAELYRRVFRQIAERFAEQLE